MGAPQWGAAEQHLKEYHTERVNILLVAEVFGPQDILGRAVGKWHSWGVLVVVWGRLVLFEDRFLVGLTEVDHFDEVLEVDEDVGRS